MSMMKSLTIGGNTFDLPTKTSDLTNDSGFVDAAGAAAAAPVQSVNSKTGAVVLDSSDVGLGNVDNVQQYSASNPPPYPVTSVNSKTGAVVLDAADVGAATPADLIALLPVDTASGPVASFPDGADNLPVLGLTVGIAPVQDLHGYSNPWPAGGGKNLFDMDTAVDGYLNSTGTAIGAPDKENKTSDFIPVTPGETYTYRAYPTTMNDQWTGFAFYSSNDMSTAIGSRSSTFSVLTTFTVPTGANYVRIGSRYLVNGKAQLEKGSAATDWAPYSNHCPISGHTEANLFRESTYDPTADPVVTIDLDGTRYGGTLDMLTGELTVTMAYGLLTDFRFVSRAQNGTAGFYFFVGEIYNLVPKPKVWGELLLTDFIGTTQTPGSEWNYADCTGVIGNSAAYPVIYIRDDSKADLASFQNTLTGQGVCYEIAEPFSVQLDENTLSTLLGQNNIWTDTNGDTSVTYRANIQKYIQKLVGA